MNEDRKMMRGATRSFSNKRCSYGKSFAGHLRVHKIGIDSNWESFSKVREDSKNEKGYFSFEDGGRSGYGLRMNPKKSRRLVDSSSAALRGQGCSNVCKECGKGFQSLKALCGHMACHSEKASGWSEEDEDAIDQISECNKQFRSVTESDQSNGYSSSEIEQEQELANCLMMLSRDDHGMHAPNSNDSMVLESKASPVRAMVRTTGGVNLPKGKLKSSEILVNSNRSNAGYLRYESQQHLHSGSSIYGHLKIKELAEPRRVKDISNADHLGKKYHIRTEYMNEPAARKNIRAGGLEYTFTNGKQMHQCDICYKHFDSHKDLKGHKSASSCYRKVELSRLPQPNTKVHNHQSTRNVSYDWKKKLGTKKSYRHECPICFRIFKSGQALGGHKRSHFLGSSVIRSPATGSEVHKVHNLIDLNLPAPSCSASFHF